MADKINVYVSVCWHVICFVLGEKNHSNKCAQSIYCCCMVCMCAYVYYDAISDVACEHNSGSTSCGIVKKEITLIAHIHISRF